MKKKYLIGSLLSTLVVVGAVMMVQPSLALFTSQDTETNNFNTGKLDIEIDEEFNCESETKICTKEVVIENTISNIDAVIRVAIIPYWQDASGKVLPEDVSQVTLDFGEGDNNHLVPINSPIEGWVNSADLYNDGGQPDSTSDGYYYYNKLVGAGKTTKQLLSKVTIPEELLRVDGKTLIVDVKAEAVQPNVNAIKDLWPNLLITGEDGQQEFNTIGQLLKDIIENNLIGGITVEKDS